MKKNNSISAPAFLVILILLFTNCTTTQTSTSSPNYTNPAWAPAYISGVRYYYLPDIETYYDLSNNDFAYMENGQWQFSSSLPPMYSNYNLYNGFSISLNSNVFQPWMHHTYYSSNYPRYYYRNKYPDFDNKRIRGFNENTRQPFLNNQNEKRGINETRNENKNEINRPFTRPAQQPFYRGKNIGQPVRVRPFMRQGIKPINNENKKNDKGNFQNNGLKEKK